MTESGKKSYYVKVTKKRLGMTSFTNVAELEEMLARKWAAGKGDGKGKGPAYRKRFNNMRTGLNKNPIKETNKPLYDIALARIE